jgi:uncharacterized protein
LNWRVLQHVIERLEVFSKEREIGASTYLITNGTLLTPDRIAYFNAHHATIQVSVDGDPATHDRFRVFKSGKPTMERIRPNIDELSRQNSDFNLRAVLTRENKHPKAVLDGLRSEAARAG